MHFLLPPFFVCWWIWNILRTFNDKVPSAFMLWLLLEQTEVFFHELPSRKLNNVTIQIVMEWHFLSGFCQNIIIRQQTMNRFFLKKNLQMERHGISATRRNPTNIWGFVQKPLSNYLKRVTWMSWQSSSCYSLLSYGIEEKRPMNTFSAYIHLAPLLTSFKHLVKFILNTEKFLTILIIFAFW